MASRTHSLFHFTQSFNDLKGILAAGAFWPRYSLEDLSFMSPSKEFFLAFPIVSFCDIPISRLDDHTDYYGSYGIGLSQTWGISSGLNPLLYINDSCPMKQDLYDSMVALLDYEDKVEQPQTEGSEPSPEKKSFLYHTARILAFTKPHTGVTKKDGTSDTKVFYDEAEWRYVACSRLSEKQTYFTEEGFADSEKLKKANEEAKESAPLTFTLNDIRYLFVRTVSEIPLLIDFINAQLGQYSANHLKILTSRILSLEDFRHDI